METIELKDFIELPYGENVTQSASISPVENGLEYEILSENSALEYLDYLNLSKTVEVLAEFFDVNAAAISKEGFIKSVRLKVISTGSSKTEISVFTSCKENLLQLKSAKFIWPSMSISNSEIFSFHWLRRIISKVK